MSNKRAIRTDQLNFESFNAVLTPKVSQILEYHKHHNEEAHPLHKLHDENRYQANEIKHPQTNITLSGYMNLFYPISYKYNQNSDYHYFFGDVANAMKKFLYEHIEIDPKAYDLHKKMYALYQEYHEIQNRIDPNTGRRISWDEQRKLHEPIKEQFAEYSAEYMTLWDEAIVEMKSEVLLHDFYHIGIETPQVHYCHDPSDTYEQYMKNMFAHCFKMEGTRSGYYNQESNKLPILKDDYRTKLFNSLKDEDPVLWLALCQWNDFFTKNLSKKIFTIALIDVSANRHTIGFYDCEIADISNKNYNKTFYQPISEVFPAWSFDSASQAVSNLDKLVIKWNDIANTFKPLCEAFSKQYEDNEEKTEASIKSGINTVLSALYSNEDNKPHVIDFIAWVHGYKHSLMENSIISNQIGTYDYTDFNRNGQKVKGYFTHLRNQPFYIDLNAIGVDEDDRMELKRIFNSHVKEQEQGHDWTMRNLIKQMTNRQNQHDEMIAQKREQFFEMIKQ